MKTVRFTFLLAALACLTATSGYAQSPVTPSTPTDFTKRDLNGGSSSGVGIVAREPQVKQTITIQFTSVTPVRVWTNREGKAMEARLLAYSAPKKGEKGPVEVIRQGKVRFLLVDSIKPIDYDLAKLSEFDRTYIQKLADAARHEPPKEVKEETKPVDEKKTR